LVFVLSNLLYFRIPLNKTDKRRHAARKSIIVGEHGTSITQERYKPSIVAIPPTSNPTNILTIQRVEKSADIEDGMIRNAKIIRIPPTETASTIRIPNVK